MKWTVLLYDADALPIWGTEVERDEAPTTMYLHAVAFGGCSARTYRRIAEAPEDGAVLHFVETGPEN